VYGYKKLRRTATREDAGAWGAVFVSFFVVTFEARTHLMSKEPDSVAEKFSLAALRAGDRAEFSRVVEAFSGPIYRLGLKMLENPQDAEDILQETFLKAFRGIHTFDGRANISTWLYRIAVNEALMRLRRKTPATVSIDEPLETPEGDEAPQEIVDWCCLPEAELMSVENRKVLDAAVDRLPPAMKVVFILRDIQELSTQETAQALNLSQEAVKTRLSRARMRLREELSGYYRERLMTSRKEPGYATDQ
jgi:RNA polymerase sigma-70 factor, ECF subfamily